MHYLALTCCTQGNHDEVVELLLRVVPSRTKRIIQIRCWVPVIVHGHIGSYEVAECPQMLAPEMRMKVLGAEHPGTIKSKHTLAWAYRGQGRYQEADELYAQVLDSRKKLLGEQHPDTLVSRHCLACTFQRPGRYLEADELELHLLDLREKTLGEERCRVWPIWLWHEKVWVGIRMQRN